MNLIEIIFVFFVILIFENLIFCENTENEFSTSEKEELLQRQKRTAKRNEQKIKDLFEVIDKNKNNTIERGELLSHTILALKHLHKNSAGDKFEIVDSNKDKKVTIDEYFIFEFKNPASVLDDKVNVDNSKETLKLRKKIERHKKTFAAADTDNKGFLNMKQYIHFKYPGFFSHMAHIIIPDFIKLIDTDGDRLINKNEYVTFFKKYEPFDETIKKQAIEDAIKDFRNYDKDGNGKIDSLEYHDILKPGYDETANTEVRFLFEDTDTDKDGLLSLDEVQLHSNRWLQNILIFEDDELEKDKSTSHLGDEL